MPTKVVELYELASDLMLSRGGAASEDLKQLLQAVFFEAHVSQRREIEDRQLDEAALGLKLPGVLEGIRSRAAGAPLPPFDGRAEVGHFVEVVDGDHKGKRGVIVTDKKKGRKPYKVLLPDGKVSDLLAPDKVRSSGLNETAALIHAMEASAEEVRSACNDLPIATKDALAEVRRRVAKDELPLLSLLQTEPLKLQSSHLSFQEYFAARALCAGTLLSGAPPWQWPAWWANTLSLGEEMDGFGEGLLRSAGVTGDSLDLSGKLAGDRSTALRAVVLALHDSALTTVCQIRQVLICGAE